ncbi:MAG: Rrf2 family iron-sulfur cluster assembly transcriptional regulator [Verrucomicrobiales bacterium]|jgi:Rrf2 family iron-sulfur cluster assembly transcriptional regulator
MSAFGYSKMSQNAIAAMSYLASQYADASARASSAEIGEARKLPKPLVAKVLTQLSQAGYVSGTPGPNGGYRLACNPDEISFYDIVCQFDTVDDTIPCPFGSGYCPNENPCPVHDKIAHMRESIASFLKETNFGSFTEEDLQQAGL